MMIGMIQTFNYSVSEISHLYSSDFSLALLNADLYLTVIAAAVTIGWIGSYFAVTRAINAIKIN